MANRHVALYRYALPARASCLEPDGRQRIDDADFGRVLAAALREEHEYTSRRSRSPHYQHAAVSPTTISGHRRACARPGPCGFTIGRRDLPTLFSGHFRYFSSSSRNFGRRSLPVPTIADSSAYGSSPPPGCVPPPSWERAARKAVLTCSSHALGSTALPIRPGETGSLWAGTMSSTSSGSSGNASGNRTLTHRAINSASRTRPRAFYRLAPRGRERDSFVPATYAKTPSPDHCLSLVTHRAGFCCESPSRLWVYCQTSGHF